MVVSRDTKGMFAGDLEATPAQLAKRMFSCMSKTLREAYAGEAAVAVDG